MASKSQIKYVTSCAIAIGVAECMWTHYQEHEKMYYVKGMISEIKHLGQKAIEKTHGQLTHKEIDRIGEKINVMVEKGLENAASYQVYLSGVIGILSDRIIDRIGEKINVMVEKGLENAASYQVYLSGVIGILSDRIAELPESSDKIKPLEKLVSVCADAHRYFEQRTRNEGLDRDGMAIMDEFNILFSEAA